MAQQIRRYGNSFIETPRYSHDVEVATLNFYETLTASVELTWKAQGKT